MDNILPVGLGVGITFLASLYLCRRTKHEPSTPLLTQKKSSPSELAPKPQQVEAEEKKKKKKKKKGQAMMNEKAKSITQIEEDYPTLFYGSINLRPSNSIHSVTAFTIKTSKILLATSKNELILYMLKNWKKDGKNNSPDKYFTSLDNNGASAVAIGDRYYYVALTFDRTIAYYDFKGGQNGIYFIQVKKFPRNIFKSNVSSLFVPQGQKMIITTGSEADTVINIWSMQGEKLTEVNSYQIEHYSIKYGLNSFFIRGWTSEVKIFTVEKDKVQNTFRKMEKTFHLAHDENPISASIDNLDMYALTLSKSDEIKLWPLHSGAYLGSISMHANPITFDSYKVELDDITKCQIHTIKLQNERYKTIVALTDGIKIVITDKNLEVLKILEGIDCQEMHLIGNKSVVLGTINRAGKLLMWNLTEVVNEIKEYEI